jgi:zinc transport system permease protein
LAVSNQDILLIGLLSFISIFVIIFYYQEFFYLTFDEEGARLAGIAVHRFNYLLLFLTAMVIAIGLRIVGTLLISSLMVVPVAASLLLTRGFKQTLMYAILIGIFSVLIGLVISFYLGLAPGGAIVLSSVTIFLVLLLIIKYAIRSE